jgi:hypothetical protein
VFFSSCVRVRRRRAGSCFFFRFSLSISSASAPSRAGLGFRAAGLVLGSPRFWSASLALRVGAAAGACSGLSPQPPPPGVPLLWISRGCCCWLASAWSLYRPNLRVFLSAALGISRSRFLPQACRLVLCSSHAVLRRRRPVVSPPAGSVDFCIRKTLLQYTAEAFIFLCEFFWRRQITAMSSVCALESFGTSVVLLVCH